MPEDESNQPVRKKNWRRIIPIFIPVLFITILMTAEYIIRTSPQFQFSQWYSPFLRLLIINLNIILILVLLVVIVRNLIKLFDERKRKILGSKFRTKLVLTMIAITIIPTGLLFITAQDLISKSIDRWYEEPVEDIVERSNQLADSYIEDFKEMAKSQALDLAQYISSENLLRTDSVPATYGFCFSPNLQGKYRVILQNDPMELAAVRIKATLFARQAYGQEPFQILLYIHDPDIRATEPIRREFVFNFPQDYLRRDEIRADQPAPVARFTLEPIAEAGAEASGM